MSTNDNMPYQMRTRKTKHQEQSKSRAIDSKLTENVIPSTRSRDYLESDVKQNALVDSIQPFNENHLLSPKHSVSTSAVDFPVSELNFVIDRKKDVDLTADTFSSSDSEEDHDIDQNDLIKVGSFTLPQIFSKFSTEAEGRDSSLDTVTSKNESQRLQLSSSLQSGTEGNESYGSYLNLDVTNNPQLRNKAVEKLLKKTEIMQQSVLTTDIEKQHQLQPFDAGKMMLKRQRRKEREKTKGSGWYDMPATEMTDEKKNDLMLLRMRQSLDPKRFYKGPDMTALPKYFQMGTIVETSADFYSSRIPKKQRKKTLVDELLEDADFRKYNKRKYAEIAARLPKKRKEYKQMKRKDKK